MIKKKERLLELVDLSLDDPFITNDLSVSVHDTSYEAYVVIYPLSFNSVNMVVHTTLQELVYIKLYTMSIALLIKQDLIIKNQWLI